MNSWFMLALAIIAEVSSTVGMKYATTHSPIFGYLLMAVMVCFSLYAFSKALLGIPLAITYAVWEGLGLLLIVVSGVYFFGESLNYQQVCAIALMLAGLLLVTLDKGVAK